jgi:hypothetical protein
MAGFGYLGDLEQVRCLLPGEEGEEKRQFGRHSQIVVSRARILRDVEREGRAGARGLRRKPSFFGGLPAVLHERLHGD